jgi:hypothetical protein
MMTCAEQGRVFDEMSIDLGYRKYRYYDNYGRNDNG